MIIDIKHLYVSGHMYKENALGAQNKSQMAKETQAQLYYFPCDIGNVL